jgi:thiamine transport system permease protein
VLALLLTYGNLEFVRRSKNKRELWFYLLIIFSPAIVAVGYYVFINEFLRLSIPSIIIVIVVNTIFILPFSYNYLSPSYLRISQEHSNLSESINLYGFKKLVIVDLSRLKRPLFNTFCISSILSSSDLVIISFFGTNDLSTLTQTIYRLLGSYRIEEARALSLLFLVYCLLYFIIPKYILGRTYKNAPFN